MDKVFLREHGPALTMQSELGHFIDSGFLEYRTLPGEGMPRLLVQTEWYNECSSLRTQEGMSWIGFFDIDEFVIILNKCAPLGATALLLAVTRPTIAPCTLCCAAPPVSGTGCAVLHISRA